MLPDTSIRLSAAYPLWLVILFIAIAAVFSLWSYRRTVPPIRNRLRLVLIVLRWGAISGGVLLLAQPVMETRHTVYNPAEVIVLVDESASMGLADGESDRDSRVDRLLRDKAFERLRDTFRLRLYSFADSLGSENENVESIVNKRPTGVGTDLGRAWMQALEQSDSDAMAAILMISDGVHNMGADPARLAALVHTPIWTVGVGSPEAVRDLMIRKITVNQVVYQGSKVPVEVGYRAVGAAGESVDVILRDGGGRRVASRRVKISGGFSEETLNFEIAVENPGKQKYTVEIERLADELTTDNNRRGFYLNVLANRMRVLLMAGPPDPGLGDLVRRLKRDENIELTMRTTRGGRFYEGDWPDAGLLERTDVLILHHFPVQSNDRRKLEAFAAEVVDKNIPIGFFDGGRISGQGLKLFEPILPVNIRRSGARLLKGRILPVKRHSVIADPDAVDIATGWDDLPPVLFSAGKYQVNPGAEILAEFINRGTGRNYPALVVSEIGGTKSIAVLVRDLWRLGLADPGDEGVIEPLLRRLVRWLAVRKINKRVAITLDRQIFNNQEEIGFTVTVLDENYMPLDGVDVSGEVAKDGKVGGRATMEGVGNGLYRGSFRSWGEGEYRLAVEARIDGQSIGEDHGKVSVEPFSIELLDTRLNEGLLRAIGAASGGGYVHIDSADSLFNTFNFPRVKSENVRKLQIWGWGWLLAAIIMLLVIEWFIRIRSGML